MELTTREQAILDMLHQAKTRQEVNSLRYWWVDNHKESDSRDWIFKENVPEELR